MDHTSDSRAVVAKDFLAKRGHELSLSAGDVVIVRFKDPKTGWWEGALESDLDSSGWFPGSCTEADESEKSKVGSASDDAVDTRIENLGSSENDFGRNRMDSSWISGRELGRNRLDTSWHSETDLSLFPSLSESPVNRSRSHGVTWGHISETKDEDL
eukprot:547361-Rhodomonas_salina.1